MSESSEKKGFFQRFTAIDLIVIALFALLVRFVFHSVYKLLYIVFPWNMAFSPVMIQFCMAIVLVLVPKQGTATLWMIATMGINLFLQGEDPMYIVGMIPAPVFTELVFYFWKRWGADLASNMVGNMVYVFWVSILHWIALNYIFAIPYTITQAVIVLAIGVFICTPIGVYVGYRTGKRLENVLG